MHPTAEKINHDLTMPPAVDLRVLRSLIRRAVPRLGNSRAKALGMNDQTMSATWNRLSRDEKARVLDLSLKGIPLMGSPTSAPIEKARPDLQRLDYFPKGVPDVLRKTLLGWGKHTDMGDHAPCLMLLEVWNRGRQAGYFEEGAPVTLSQLVEYAQSCGWHTTRDTLRKGMKQAYVLGILRSSEGQIERYGGGGITEGEKTSQNTVGRPSKAFVFCPVSHWLVPFLKIRRKRAFEYCHRDVRVIESSMFAGDPALSSWKSGWLSHQEKLMTPSELAKLQNARQRAREHYDELINKQEKQFRLEALLSAQSTPLPEGEYPNQIVYRDYYRRARAEAHPGRQISMVKAADEIGRSVPALRKTNRRMGIRRTPVFEHHPIDPDRDLRAQIAAQTGTTVIHKDGSTYYGAKLVASEGGDDQPAPEWSISADNHHELEAALKNAATWAQEQKRRGKSVSLRVQKASAESVIAAPLPRPKRKKESAPKQMLLEEQALTISAPKPEGNQTPKRSLKPRRPAWDFTGFSPSFITNQLAMRGFADHPEGLIDLKSGEVLTPETHPIPPLTQ